MISVDCLKLKEAKRAAIERHTKPSNLKAITQVLNTVLPLAGLWYAIVWSASISYWLTAAVTLLMSLFVLRALVLLHECGHNSLFCQSWLNKSFGFMFGVITGMPQYVWSQHHAYHHATNGNWAKYRGPLCSPSVNEFAAMSSKQQQSYERSRNLWIAPLGGFVYLLFNPRFNWMKGTIGLVAHLVKSKIKQPGISFKQHAASFKTRYWASPAEYWHMTGNNLVLLSLWPLMCACVGTALFFSVYSVSIALAGGGGIALFTVQHNFEHAYASGDEGWDYDEAALHGTSFLILPAWINWFTANIAFHHVHHLSSKIPNYCLAACHKENAPLFADVKRVRLSEIKPSLKYLLWDQQARRMISFAEYRASTQSGVSQSDASSLMASSGGPA